MAGVVGIGASATASLIEEMERLSEVAARRARVIEGAVDPRSPYFGRMVLEEGPRKREVLIGRSTYLDSKTGIRIVDWREAPIAQLFYRYQQGDEFEEEIKRLQRISEAAASREQMSLLPELLGKKNR